MEKDMQIYNANIELHEVVSEKELDRVLCYLEKDKVNCIYLYIDLMIYGLTNPNIRVWYNEDMQGLKMVIMQYHKSFQVYSNRLFDETDCLIELVDRDRKSVV